MLPLQITMRDMPAATEVLESHIRQKAEKLNRFCDKISSCRVVIEFDQKHKHQGKLYNVRIDITVPGKELVVTRKRNEDIYVSLRDAFNAVFRQLEEHSRKRHGHVKTHCDVLHGRVARLMQADGYGFIEGSDGDEYYFSVTNVSYPSFQQLLIGDNVEYQKETSSEGPHAHHVVLERRTTREIA
jgi:ribosomal subunit interface protein